MLIYILHIKIGHDNKTLVYTKSHILKMSKPHFESLYFVFS